MDLSRTKLENAFQKVITRNRGADPITLSEKLVDTLEIIYELSDTGYGAPPLRITEDEDRAGEKVKEMPAPKREVMAPEAPRAGMLLTPDDPEFRKAEQALRAERERGSIPSPTRISQVGAPAGQESNVQYWTADSLVTWLNENFPRELIFTPHGMPDHVKVLARLNVEAQINIVQPHAARVTYSHESMNQDGMDASTMVGDGQSKTNISLIASKLYTTNQQSIDVERDVADLLDQLKGLYKPRPRQMEPGWIGDSAMDGWNANQPGMKDSESIRGTRGWNMVDNPMGGMRETIIQQNRQLGSPGQR